MAEGKKPLETLNEQIAAISDAHKNITGLVEKLSRIQMALSESGLEGLANQVGQPFSELSQVAERLQELIHNAETERKRMQSEG